MTVCVTVTEAGQLVLDETQTDLAQCQYVIGSGTEAITLQAALGYPTQEQMQQLFTVGLVIPCVLYLFASCVGAVVRMFDD